MFDDYESLSGETSDVIIALVRRKPHAVLSLAAGDTPRLTYQFLAERAVRQGVDFSRCTFIGLDEWVGIPPENPGSCLYFLQNNLFNPLGIARHQIHVFNALASDLASECKKMDTAIKAKEYIDLMLVGVGMNGHIGFNEPGVAEDLYTHVVALDATTRRVGQKYFKQHTELEYGITLGLKHLLESRRVIMMASGRKKADVIRLALEGPVNTQLPASIIRKHPKGIVMVDREAAEGLKGRR